MVSPKILGVQAKNPIWPPDYRACDYQFMPGLKLIHVSNRGPRYDYESYPIVPFPSGLHGELQAELYQDRVCEQCFETRTSREAYKVVSPEAFFATTLSIISYTYPYCFASSRGRADHLFVLLGWYGAKPPAASLAADGRFSTTCSRPTLKLWSRAASAQRASITSTEKWLRLG